MVAQAQVGFNLEKGDRHARHTEMKVPVPLIRAILF